MCRPQRYKRIRLQYKKFVDGTKVIEPFIKYKDLDDHLFPTLEEQNIIHQQNSKLVAKWGPGNHVKARMTQKAGNPFYKIDCKMCGVSKHNYNFSVNGSGSSHSRTCSQCRNTKDQLKHVRQYSQEEKDALKAQIAPMVDEVSNTFLFNANKFTSFLTRMLNKGYYKIIDIILERGVTASFVCKFCNTSCFLHEMVIDSKSKDCMMKYCNSCQSARKNQVHRKALCINQRFGEKGVEHDGVDLINNCLRSQGRLCYYSFIPMQDDMGPWKWSPERIEREGTYFGDSQNVVLCCEIFNVGGTRNFSHKLLLQTFFSNTFKIFYDSYLYRPCAKFMNVGIQNAKNRSLERGKKVDRWDKSNEFTIDVGYMRELAKKQGYRCALSGIPLVFQSKHPWTASLDRIDTFRGYIPGNVRWVIGRFNSRHTWDDATWKVLTDSLDKNIHKVWDRHYGEKGPPYGQFLFNLRECPPDKFWFPPKRRRSVKKK